MACWSALSGEQACSSGWTGKTHVQRQQGWQMSAMPPQDYLLFIPCVESPSEARRNRTHIWLQRLGPGSPARCNLKAPSSNLTHTQGHLKCLSTVKTIHGHLFPVFKTFIFNLRQLWSQFEAPSPKLTTALGQGWGRNSLRVSFRLVRSLFLRFMRLL